MYFQLEFLGAMSADNQLRFRRNNPKPSLLIVATTWWPSVAMLASSLQQVGFAVTVMCPKGHVAWHAEGYRCRLLDSVSPLQSLRHAIAEDRPTLLVPADDRSVLFLMRLHRDSKGSVRDLVERSLGPAGCFGTIVSRVPLLEAARDVGLSVPEGGEVGSIANLDRWMDRIPAPWVINIDGAWGGEGVRIAKTREEARQAFLSLSRGLPFHHALKRRLVNGDPFWLQDRTFNPAPAVSLQSFIKGRPGNCALFCLKGEILGATVVETEASCNDMGPSTLVRLVERPAVLSGARRLVHTLGLSGFIGLDFMVDEVTGEAFLIEMNPRITAPCRFRTAGGTDPIAAAGRALGCGPMGGADIPARSLFASFPLAWQTDPHDPRLALCQDDVPWHEPNLVEEALKPVWPERGVVARLPSRLRSILHSLRGGERPPDYRTKSFDWWLTQASLRPPPDVDVTRRSASRDPSLIRFETDSAVLARPS